MNPWIAFVLGLLIGWLVEWIIDWIYWRKRVNASGAELAACKSQMEKLRAENALYPTRTEKLQSELAACSDRAAALEAEKTQLGAELQARLDACAARSAALEAETTRLQADVNAKDAEIADLKARLGISEAAPARSGSLEMAVESTAPALVQPKAPDNLEVIVGIGPVIARLLNNAGIFTFADLAKLTVEDLRGIVGKRIERLADEESLLAQARELAAKKG